MSTAQQLTEPHPVTSCEKSAVIVELWSWDRKTMLALGCTVSHVGDTVVHVSFAEGWRVTAQAVGLDDSFDTQGHIWTLAAQAFRRADGE